MLTAANMGENIEHIQASGGAAASVGLLIGLVLDNVLAGWCWLPVLLLAADRDPHPHRRLYPKPA
jgi:hypothetical protein